MKQESGASARGRPPPGRKPNPFGYGIPWAMVNQQTAEAVAVSADLPLYVRLHWLAVARVDHVGHAHFMPAEAAGLLKASLSQISKSIASLVVRLLLCEGSRPTCLRLPMDHWQKRALASPSAEWWCPQALGPLRQESWLPPGSLSLRPMPKQNVPKPKS